MHKDLSYNLSQNINNNLIHIFNKNRVTGSRKLVDLLGNKAANLSDMKNNGINVPCGFVLTTQCCQQFFNQEITKEEILEITKNAITEIEEIYKLSFTEGRNKLLLSVRSGAAISMPGMMDTILNLGMNPQIVEEMCQIYDKNFVYDTYRRFIHGYANIVLQISNHELEEIIDHYKEKHLIVRDCEFTVQHNQKIIEEMQLLINSYQKSIPEDVFEQLIEAIIAVFSSINSDRAQTYRQINNITSAIYTTATVQMMVFGNLNDDSGTGVCFTRNPANGNKEIYGEFLQNAQGEDIVAGTRTPNAITEKYREANASTNPSLETLMPEVFQELTQVMHSLETKFQDMQDIEFTVQNKQLFILQTRSGKRTPAATLKIALDLYKENLISAETMIKKITPEILSNSLHPTIDESNLQNHILGKGLPASPGCASGLIAFSSEEVEKNHQLGKKSILVRLETSPEDIKGMYLAEGILTVRGGMTSHAAVVARGMGKCCVCGAKELQIDYAKQVLKIDDKTLTNHDMITLNGSSGKIIEGQVETSVQCDTTAFQELFSILKKYAKLEVLANAESINDIKNSLAMGAEGIGLCRTEHMFFDANKIMNMRAMIISDNQHTRNQYLDKLYELQKEDFLQIFQIIQNKPITIRLLDPPLHEFLPQDQETQQKLADFCETSIEKIQTCIKSLHENNPMLGMRGCRLGIVYPEIYKMQIKAIFEAAQTVKIQHNIDDIKIKIMIPLIINETELSLIKEDFLQIAQQYPNIKCDFGIMIETPASALIADKLADKVDFFSFGSNDLTQTTLALSRDDSSIFMTEYLKKNIFSYDPFCTINEDTVGQLMIIAIHKALAINPKLKIGICGEHGGDINSIAFIQKNMHYTSCSPFRIPITLLQSALLNLN